MAEVELAIPDSEFGIDQRAIVIGICDWILKKNKFAVGKQDKRMYNILM